jgi:hypothetical protein
MHGGRHPRLTARRREHLLRYCAIYDRMARRRGYGLEQLLTLMDLRLGWTRREETALPVEQIHSLDFYVCQLRQLARQERRRRRGRRELALQTHWLQPWWSGRRPATSEECPPNAAAPEAPPPAPRPPVVTFDCECGVRPHRAWCPEASC